MDNSFGQSPQKQQIIQQVNNSQKDIQLSDQNNQPYVFPIILDQAKPILPPGTYIENSSHTKYEYKFLNERGKLNRTSFPDVKFRNWELFNNNYNFNNNSLTSDLPFIQKKSNQREREEQIPSEINCQFNEILKSRTLIYKRINNDKCNQIVINGVKTRIYCSVFFPNKIKQNHCGQNLIFQHLTKNQQQLQKRSKDFPFSVKNQLVVFNSCFQSGNLFVSFKAPPNNDNLPLYQLYLQNDTNTKGCTQWFYFTVQNRIKGKIKFRIMNFYKPTSLFNMGMKLLCSKDQKEWKRTGIAIHYKRYQIDQNRSTFCLEFIHDFDSLMDTTYFCYGYPYTYTQNLKGFLKQLTLQTDQAKKFIKKDVLCQTNMGNKVFILTITDNVYKIHQKKPMIYIIARQHPGQTPASFIMEGLLKFLLSNRVQAQQLRANFTFRIMPMVNIDGTINGNYRSNCSGNDVNRQWHCPSKKVHPQIYFLKKQILSNKKYITFFLDIHAHSRKMNSFFYGNKAVNNQNKFYPFTCSKLCKFISYEESAFSDDPSKKTTARVVIQTQLNLKNSLTFQCSFYGWEDKVKKLKHHFKVKDFQYIGQSLALGMFYTQVGIKKTVIAFTDEKQSKISTLLLASKDSVQKNPMVPPISNKNMDKSKAAIWKNIEKNSQKIYFKWKKMQEFQKDIDERQLSQGSSIDPQHFQLQQEEEQQLQEMFNQQIEEIKKCRGIQESQNQKQFFEIKNRTTIKDGESNLMNKKQSVRSKSIKNPQLFKSQNIDEKRITKMNADWIYSNQQDSTFLPIGAGLRNSLVVKQLESQLQIYKRKNQQQHMRRSRAEQLGRNSHYKSLQPQITTQSAHTTSNYRYNIIQMKKALKYFLQNKDSKNNDYEHYQNCFKTVEQNDSAISFKEKMSHRRILSKKR